MALHDPHPRDQYIPQVRSFLTSAAGEELELRCSLLLIRDAATVAAQHAGEAAAPITEHVVRLATAHAFAAVPIETLRALRLNLGRLVQIATCLDDMEGLSGRG